MSFGDLGTDLEEQPVDGINPGRVEEIYAASLAEDLPEDSEYYKVVEGILNPTAFDTVKLEQYRAEVKEMLAWLPLEFQPPSAGGGGGWSFLNACMDRQGRQWTGLHRTQDMLFQLGIGLGLAEYLMPREMWSVFPGGLPYVMVK